MSGTKRHHARSRFWGIVLALGGTTAVVGVASGPVFGSTLREQNTKRVDAAVTIPPSDTVVPMSGGGPVQEPTGDWVCPVPGAKFTNDWGNPRSGGRRHEGTDMLAPKGTPVVAPVAGVVKRSSSGSGGLMMYLKSADGFTYVGMHLSAHGAEGPVRAGEVIGYVGDTGNARGTDHLHFEIHPAKGVKLNPYATLKRSC